MRLRALRPSQGIRFAWWPVWTPEGKVWLEHVHFTWHEGWGWGSDGHYEYRRMIPQDRYDAGERVRLLTGAKAYATPPGDPRVFCKNYNPNGPTPCHYPHCLVSGMDLCEVCIGRDTDEGPSDKRIEEARVERHYGPSC